MLYLLLSLFSILIPSGCASSPEAQTELDNSILQILGLSPDKFHTPEELEKILTESQVKFEFISANYTFEPNPNELTPVPEPDRYTNVARKGVHRKVYRDAPPEWMEEWFQLALKEGIDRKKLEGARNWLNQAIVTDPKYFKSYTMYGKVLNAHEKFNEARPFLEKALELNPLDYEANYEMSKSLQGNMKFVDAFDYMVRAYMLNPSNKEIEQAFIFLARGNHFDLRTKRLEFPFRIKEISEIPKKIGVEISKDRERLVKPMATCMALWKHDPEYSDLILQGDYDPYEFTMYRECLLVYAMTIRDALNKSPDTRLPTDTEFFIRAIGERHLESLVLWEIVGKKDPYLIYIVTDDQRKRIEMYIKSYVLFKMSPNSGPFKMLSN